MWPRRAVDDTMASWNLICGLICGLSIAMSTLASEQQQTQSDLRLVSVVFRHGDRTPDPVEMYPRDPHYNESFWPEGLGGLTNAGKRRLYELGELLRARYSEFLGELYTGESVSGRSTDYRRTKMCLQLVLAGLYPPSRAQSWSERLAWQPIPTSYASSAMDWLMIPEECPEYLRERAAVEASEELGLKLEGFRAFMDELGELTGRRVSRPVDMYNLYHVLSAEAAMNLTLPAWAASVFPRGRLLDGINLEYEIFGYNALMRRLNGGKLLYRIVKDMKAVMLGTMPRARRISLFSGHETNVVALLQALGLYEPHVPAYSSAVLVELRRIDGRYYVKVIYYLGIPSEFVVQQVRGCEVLCPFNQFVSLLRDVLPSKYELTCDKRKKSKTP